MQVRLLKKTNDVVMNNYTTRARVGYEMIDSHETRSTELAIIISYPTKASEIIVLLQTILLISFFKKDQILRGSKLELTKFKKIIFPQSLQSQRVLR